MPRVGREGGDETHKCTFLIPGTPPPGGSGPMCCVGGPCRPRMRSSRPPSVPDQGAAAPSAAGITVASNRRTHSRQLRQPPSVVPTNLPTKEDVVTLSVQMVQQWDLRFSLTRLWSDETLICSYFIHCTALMLLILFL